MTTQSPQLGNSTVPRQSLPSSSSHYEIAILGAGPAGLSCAYEHTKRHRTGLLL